MAVLLHNSVCKKVILLKKFSYIYTHIYLELHIVRFCEYIHSFHSHIHIEENYFPTHS